MWYKGFYLKNDFISLVIYHPKKGAVYRCWTVSQAIFYINHIV